MLLSLINPHTFQTAIEQVKIAYLSEKWLADREDFALPFGKPLKAFFELPKENVSFTGVESGRNAGGYTDFMISQWLTEFVLVPLDLVVLGRKRLPPNGIFWKSVVASTGQPANLWYGE